MLYAVIACEQMYVGLYGMVSYFVVEGTEEDAEEAAIEASYEVMQDYSSIMEDLEDAAREELEFENEEDCEESAEWDDEYSRALEEQMQENLQYEIYPIVKETNLSLEQLDGLFNNSPEEFVREYCNLPGFSNGYR